MKKSPHQIFVDELQKRLIAGTPHQNHVSKNHNGTPDEDAYKEDIMKELERKFDELFGDLDAND